MDETTGQLNEILPGTQPGSTINGIYTMLKQGCILTTLDAVISNRTVNLTKYISLLRLKYGVPVRDQWVELPNKKRVKQFWIQK